MLLKMLIFDGYMAASVEQYHRHFIYHILLVHSCIKYINIASRHQSTLIQYL
jgi:hypothetical protein